MNPPVNNMIEQLRPKTRTNIMDLVSEAGVDVTSWKYRTDGSLVESPAENPNYCYDWAFGSAFEKIVLCIWHDSLVSSSGNVVFNGNLRKLGEDLQLIANNPGHDARERNRTRQQATRARSFDTLVKEAYERLLPIRMLINEGSQANRDNLGEASSRVSLRELDTDPWFVHYYDYRTGECTIVRGVSPSGAADDSDLDRNQALASDDEIQNRAIKARKGQKQCKQPANTG